MPTKTSKILTKKEVSHKIRRIAYQIYESNSNEKEIILAGISSRGFLLSKEIAKIVKEITGIKVVLVEVFINKTNPLDNINTSLDLHKIENKSLVLIDDVLNSGTTLMYGVKYFLNIPLKKFKTAVLVNRNHKKFPVKADFKGISLSTSLKEHVEVTFLEDGIEVFLK